MNALLRLKNRFNDSLYGFVIDWSFHKKNRWVSAFTPYFVQAVVEAFQPVIVTSQEEYFQYAKRLKYIISMEPGWGAPRISFDRNANHLIAMMASDPHNKTKWFQYHVISNNVTYVLSQYYKPFFHHFPHFPAEKFIHFPWAVPDQFVTNDPLKKRSGDVAIFGASGGDAYDVRDWCRRHPDVKVYSNSGVMNKKVSDRGYFEWLRNFDAVIAAGSSCDSYDLVTPKYFEIASSGALLFGQFCNDLELLGFNDTNSLIFTRESFDEKIRAYTADPVKSLVLRINGRSLISRRHLISHRITLLKQLLR